MIQSFDSCKCIGRIAGVDNVAIGANVVRVNSIAEEGITLDGVSSKIIIDNSYLI